MRSLSIVALVAVTSVEGLWSTRGRLRFRRRLRFRSFQKELVDVSSLTKYNGIDGHALKLFGGGDTELRSKWSGAKVEVYPNGAGNGKPLTHTEMDVVGMAPASYYIIHLHNGGCGNNITIADTDDASVAANYGSKCGTGRSACNASNCATTSCLAQGNGHFIAKQDGDVSTGCTKAQTLTQAQTLADAGCSEVRTGAGTNSLWYYGFADDDGRMEIDVWTPVEVIDGDYCLVIHNTPEESNKVLTPDLGFTGTTGKPGAKTACIPLVKRR